MESWLSYVFGCHYMHVKCIMGQRGRGERHCCRCDGYLAVVVDEQLVDGTLSVHQETVTPPLLSQGRAVAHGNQGVQLALTTAHQLNVLSDRREVNTHTHTHTHTHTLQDEEQRQEERNDPKNTLRGKTLRTRRAERRK